MEWKDITTIDEWNELLEKSTEKEQVILKHSTTCPVSFNALDEYNDYLQDEQNENVDYTFDEYNDYLQDEPNENVDYTLVKVRESRPVSNQIEADLDVKHEAPQIISFKNKAKYWSTSHWSVTKAHMKAVLD